LVVSLAPEHPAAPSATVVAAGLEDPVVSVASKEEPWAAIAATPVELAGTAARIASLAAAKDFAVGGVEGIVSLPNAVPLLTAASLPYLPTVNGVLTASQGARASPPERDGHRAVAAKAEEQKPPAAGAAPSGPLENQGLGAGGGSAGGVAGAASSRYFAIATAPLRFDFPSTFAHAPLPSTAPTGALEDAPTTRPG
jgi:hypothetical protein